MHLSAGRRQAPGRGEGGAGAGHRAGSDTTGKEEVSATWTLQLILANGPNAERQLVYSTASKRQLPRCLELALGQHFVPRTS